VTSWLGHTVRPAATFAPLALLCALALPMQTDSGLMVALGALAAALTAIGLSAVLAGGRAPAVRVAPVTAGVRADGQGRAARQHDPDAAGRVRPRAPGRVRRNG
jgi:hypothetical protein